MKNIIKKIVLFVVLLAALYGVGRVIDVAYGSYQFVPRQPYLTLQTKHSVHVKWQTPQEEIGSLSYGLLPKELNSIIKEQSATKKHSLTLSDLQACTQYFYKVSSSSLDIDNQGRSFTTLCDDKETQRLWVIGDSGKAGKNQQEVYKQMLTYIDNDFNKLDMWILLGDNAYKSGTQKQYNKSMFEPYSELVKRFTPWAVIGNHDARRWAFYDIFDFPTKAQSGGVASGSEKFYSVDDGNLHLVMLDSETTDLSKDGAMAQWLKKDLQANTKPWVIVAFHTPPYTDGGHTSDSSHDSGGRMKEIRENFIPLFDQFGVDLVLSGHSHDYERSKLILNHTGTSDTFSDKNIVQNAKSSYSKPLTKKQNSGTIYLVCGSSAKVDRADLKHPALPFSHQMMGSLIIEITPTTLNSKFITINGKIADQFKITKTNTQK